MTPTVFFAAAVVVGGCTPDAGRGTHQQPQESQAMPTPAQSQEKSAANVVNLPFARGKTFQTLDAYLAHLETLRAIDLPWWQEIEPGVYQRVVSIPNAKREIATRKQLMERFGFTR